MTERPVTFGTATAEVTGFGVTGRYDKSMPGRLFAVADAQRGTARLGRHGSGIPSDVRSRVFEPLFSTKSFGAGLGLATVKRIIEQHGGTIALASEPVGGAAFYVTLPLAGVERAAA